MALSILKELLEGYVQSLFDEGVVNDQFSQIQTLKRIREPDFVVQLINTYLVDMETLISELTIFSDSLDVDFSKLALLARNAKGLSAW
ncbi:Signal transduction histidine kinase, phosphotransfer (Hpt) domain containing protein [Parasponia andersonii]|uniref:Histidine-containing phosphotransfer protein n=1 Tax=Parasponia andersonii TaxID=3476 RepID=A0A2P5ANU5_PARAD|nr:Signal transduction histidine kinase, phosphotransfer (Hpt) domain containing protein [Parasponia andersonii]